MNFAPAEDLQASVQGGAAWFRAQNLTDPKILALSANQNVSHPRLGESQMRIFPAGSGREFGHDCFSIASFASFSLITLNTIINVITNLNSNNNDDNNNNNNNNNNDDNNNVNMNTGRRKRSSCTPMTNHEVIARVQRRASERFLAWFGQTLEENPECLIALLCALNNNNNNHKNKDNEDINNNNSWFQGSGLIARLLSWATPDDCASPMDNCPLLP